MARKLPAKTKTKMKTQQPIECTPEQAEALFADDEFCAQEKLDGVRVLITIRNGIATAETRNGKAIAIPESAFEWLPSRDCILDGEIVGNDFRPFDMPSAEGDYLQRWRHLNHESDGHALPIFFNEGMKRRLSDDVNHRGDEGVVFKRLSAPYRAGYNTDQFKLKFWKSDTFRVVAVDDRTITLEGAGKCTGTAQVGDLVEIRFQKRHESGKLASPVMLGVRRDLE